ncbi:LOW QUALITY PROTEIN: extracellular calcium-sensing receptor-like [Trichechus inunguis]
MTSPESKPMAELLSTYRIPQISHGSQQPQFSNRLQFPSFLHTVASSAHQTWVLAQLLSHFNWTWVGLVGSDNGNFELLEWQLQVAVRPWDSYLAFSRKISSPGNSISSTARTIAWSPTARVTVCDCYHFHFRHLAEALWKKNVTRRMWIFSTSFLYAPSVLGPRAQELLNGNLILAIHSGVMPGFEDFLLTLHPAVYPGNSLVRKLWEELQGCRWPVSGASTQSARDRAKHCTGLENMTAAYLPTFKLSDLTVTYQAYLAAKALLAAYQNLVSCAPGEGPFLGDTCASTRDAKLWQMNANLEAEKIELLLHKMCRGSVPLIQAQTWEIALEGTLSSDVEEASAPHQFLSLYLLSLSQVLHYIQKVCFTTRAQEEVFLTKDGEVPAMFDIKNIYVLPDQSRQTAIVGHLDLRGPPGKQLLITDSTIIWFWFSQLEGRHATGIYPTYQECPEDQWPNTGRQCIPKTLDFLSYHEPLSTVLAVCMALLFLLALAILGIFTWHHHTPIIQANNHQLSYLLLASLALCFLCPFMCIGHPGPLTCAVCLAASGVTFTVCVSTVLAKTISVVHAFHATQPNAKIRKWVGLVLPSTIPIVCSLVQAALYMFWVIRWPPRPVNSTEPRATVTVMCHEGSLELFYAMLGYLGLLGLVSLLVAFPAHRLPDTFNEAKHITLSMLVCSCVWVSFIPAHVSACGKDTVAVEVFAILASGAGLMSCFFFPKCYIILLCPEKNTREQMLGRHHLKRKKKK